MTDTQAVTGLQRMTAAGWSPETRKAVAQACLLGQAQAIRAGKPGEAERLGAIIEMLRELDAEPASQPCMVNRSHRMTECNGYHLDGDDV